MRRYATVGVAIPLASLVASATLAYWSIGAASEKPGLLTVTWIVAAGFSVTAVVFQALKLSPARQLVQHPVAAGALRTHLSELRAARD